MQNSSDPFQLTRFFDKLRTALSLKKRVTFHLLLEQEKGSGDELGILIACSGGIDSLALLYMMSELKDELDLKIGCCYVDHKARPESGDEAKFVDNICHELQVPFFAGIFDENFWDDTKSNFEERARIERYRILHKIAIDNNFGYIATAHHRDDQVETVLMRILERGSGLKGLCGIKPVNPIPRPLSLSKKERGELLKAPTIIRPLLNIPKSDIVDYMKGRQYLSDQTNNDTIYRRNHYRKIVIPLLKEALPDVDIAKHISDLAQNAERERAVMEEFMREFWCSLGAKDFSPLHIPRDLIKAHSDDFWITAFTYLFSFGDLYGRKIFRPYSHSTQTLKDITAFIRKTDPGTASYNPYILERNREGVRIR